MTAGTIQLIAGLGNPGPDYARTRHNAGFWFLDALAQSLGCRLGNESKLHAEVGKAQLGGQTLWLMKPTTFMNRSGLAVGAALRYYKIDPAHALIVHDELDLPPGSARLKFDGGHGGQNGLRDISAGLGSQYWRLRIGIGHPGHKDLVTPWVLGRPGQAQELAMQSAISAAIDVMPTFCAGDSAAAMKTLHTPAPK